MLRTAIASGPVIADVPATMVPVLYHPNLDLQPQLANQVTEA